jgi:hypothetical protein
MCPPIVYPLPHNSFIYFGKLVTRALPVCAPLYYICVVGSTAIMLHILSKNSDFLAPLTLNEDQRFKISFFQRKMDGGGLEYK